MVEDRFDPDVWLDEAKDIPLSQKLEEYGKAPFSLVIFTAPEFDEIHADAQAMEEEIANGAIYRDALESVGGLLFALLDRVSRFQGYEGGPLEEPVVQRGLDMWRELRGEDADGAGS